jgi:hypothetical protein
VRISPCMNERKIGEMRFCGVPSGVAKRLRRGYEAMAAGQEREAESLELVRIAPEGQVFVLKNVADNRPRYS